MDKIDEIIYTVDWATGERTYLTHNKATDRYKRGLLSISPAKIEKQAKEIELTAKDAEFIDSLFKSTGECVNCHRKIKTGLLCKTCDNSFFGVR